MLLATAAALAADQWPQFRGPHAGAIPDDPALPDTWSETENIVWKTPIPGLGWSSPVVWDDHIFITSAISEGKEKDPVPGLVRRARPHQGRSEPAVDGLRRRLQDRQGPLGARAAPAAIRRS